MGYDRFVGEHAYRQLAELYRALRLYMNCFQPSMKLLSKHREGKKMRYVYDPAKTPLQRLLLSGILSVEKQHELNAVVQSLDPLRLLKQLVQLQKSLFRYTVEGNSFISHTSSLPIHAFSVEQCTTEVAPVEVSLPDSPAGLAALFQEQEKRKRVLGWRRTHKDPFEGEWEQVLSWLVTNPERPQRRHLPGAAAPLPWLLSAITNPHPAAGHAENQGLPGTEAVKDVWREEVIQGPSPS